jgi:hypothetical protein
MYPARMLDSIASVWMPVSAALSPSRVASNTPPTIGRPRAPMLLEHVDQAQVLLAKHPAHDLERARRGPLGPVLGVDAGGGQRRCDLRAGAVHDDRGQADLMQEVERAGQALEVVGEQAAADFDDGEPLLFDLGELLEVLVDLLAAAEVAEQLDDELTRREHCGLRGMTGCGGSRRSP